MFAKVRGYAGLTLMLALSQPSSTGAAARSTPEFIQAPTIRGYDFTISASSTDPHVNQAPPASGTRELFLWVTCATPGLAALECQVNSSLGILGFTPLNGVMNVGTADHLLLAVPGCPSGSAVNHLLGKWFVDDQGGSICLGAPEGGAFCAVDCEAVPGAAYEPGVTGFASSGAPCEEGQQGCSEEAPERIVFEETARVPGTLAFGDAWSPDGSWLAVSEQEGTSLVASEGGATRALSAFASEVRWSPDGSCAAYKSLQQDHYTSAIAVIRASDGATHELGRGEDFTHQIWTGDGRVHTWIWGGLLRSFPRPDTWAPPRGYVPPDHEALVALGDPATRRIRYRRFSLVTARETSFTARDLPSDREFLVQDVRGRPPIAVAVVGATATSPEHTIVLSVLTGETLLEFAPAAQGEGPFYGTTLASDGEWVVGHVERNPDGHREDATLWVASRTGRWVLPVDGVASGTEPKCPHRGDWIAFNDPTEGTVHIGRLRVVP